MKKNLKKSYNAILRFFVKLYIKRQSFRLYDMRRDLDCDTYVSFTEVDGIYFYMKYPKNVTRPNLNNKLDK